MHQRCATALSARCAPISSDYTRKASKTISLRLHFAASASNARIAPTCPLRVWRKDAGGSAGPR
eukprot:1232731-Rhodomonas_salina.4